MCMILVVLWEVQPLTVAISVHLGGAFWLRLCQRVLRDLGEPDWVPWSWLWMSTAFLVCMALSRAVLAAFLALSTVVRYTAVVAGEGSGGRGHWMYMGVVASWCILCVIMSGDCSAML
jgi:hypothetical protein